MGRDHVEHILEQWRRERPDLDVSPIAVIARITRLSRLLEREIEALYHEHGLNQPQFAVLAALRRAGPPYCLSPTALYNSLLVSSGAVTNRLDRLTAAGLVKRLPDPNDGRSKLVALTPKGRRLIDETFAAHIMNEHRLLDQILPAAQRTTLARLLRDLLLGFTDDQPTHSAADPRAIEPTARSNRRRSAGAARSRTRPPARRAG